MATHFQRRHVLSKVDILRDNQGNNNTNTNILRSSQLSDDELVHFI